MSGAGRGADADPSDRDSDEPDDRRKRDFGPAGDFAAAFFSSDMVRGLAMVVLLFVTIAAGLEMAGFGYMLEGILRSEQGFAPSSLAEGVVVAGAVASFATGILVDHLSNPRPTFAANLLTWLRAYVYAAAVLMIGLVAGSVLA